MVDYMQRNQEKLITENEVANEELIDDGKNINISDLADSMKDEKGQEQLPDEQAIQESKWAKDLDILNEAEISEESSFANSQYK